MIPEQFLTRFKPDSQVPHSRVKKLLITIRQFAGSEVKKEDTETERELKPELISAGLQIQEKLETAKDDLITELVAIFFSLSNEERDNLDFEVREEMYAKIKEARPQLIDFLSLSQAPSNSMKTESKNLPIES